MFVLDAILRRYFLARRNLTGFFLSQHKEKKVLGVQYFLARHLIEISRLAYWFKQYRADILAN